MRRIQILGGGPAGATAAIAALREGGAVCVAEKAAFPRHKVCGEFLSPEVAPALDELGLLGAFNDLHPARCSRLRLSFAKTEKRALLPEAAYGLSRYAFDDFLRQRAVSLGAEWTTDPVQPPDIVSTGRATRSARGNRLFGFKSHFSGPCDDAISLFFFEGGYVGVNSIEGGMTNVCGLAREGLLQRLDFDFDELARSIPALRERLDPLTRLFPRWLATGPLVYRQRFVPSEAYLAGDALSFVDPFTGTGLLAAVLSGLSAGRHAARRSPVGIHADNCRGLLRRPFLTASLFRTVIDAGAADLLVRLAPASWLVRLTRPAARA